MNLPNPGRGQTSESEAALGFAPRRRQIHPPAGSGGAFFGLFVNLIQDNFHGNWNYTIAPKKKNN